MNSLKSAKIRSLSETEDKMKIKTIVVLCVLLIGLVATLAISLILKENENAVASPVNTINITPGSRIEASADWASNAVMIDDLMRESDLVVRARVSEAPITRVLRNEIPVWDENNNIVGSTVSETLFSDTVFEVIKTYRGEPRSSITVMQTGGFDPTVSKSVIEVTDDPLYNVGEEYILFLVDISGDPVQATDRELYRIANPFGRYGIEGKNVFSYGYDPNSVNPLKTSDIIELETKIEDVVQELKN